MKVEALGSTTRTSESALMLCVCFLVGMGLVIGQLIPSTTQEVAEGESLPQILLWLVAAALLATDHVLTRYLVPRRLDLDRSSPSTNWDGLRWPMGVGFILLGWITLATLAVYGRGNLRYAVNGLWQWFGWALTTLVLFHLCQRRQVGEGLQRLMVALAWLVVIHGLYQVTISLPADRIRFRENPQEVLREAGVVNAPPGSSSYLLFERRLQDNSPTGPFALTNSLAGFLIPWTLVLIARALRPVGPREGSSADRLLSSLIALCLLVCLIATKSRTGWIALAIGMVAILLSHRAVLRGWSRQANQRGQLVMFATMVVLASGLVVWGLQRWDPKLLGEAGRSFAYRAEYWTGTLRIITEHPWMGIGLGNFQSYYAAYKPILASETVADPHNFLLETWATTGLVGFASVSFLILWLLRVLLSEGPSAETNQVPPLARPKSEAGSHVGSDQMAMIGLFAGAIAGALAIGWGVGRSVLRPIIDRIYLPFRSRRWAWYSRRCAEWFGTTMEPCRRDS